MTVQQAQQQAFADLLRQCIDNQDITIDTYNYAPELLQPNAQTQQVSEILHSHLLKSNCLITNQPDWGSVLISYRGRQIDQAALLRYLVSFRHHNEFHEQCVERIFMDIKRQLQPEQLTVYARYTGVVDSTLIRFDPTSKPHQHQSA